MKNETSRFAASFRNAGLLADILHDKPGFVSDINAFRNKWHIPKNGLSEQELAAWRVQFAKERRSYKPTDDDITLEVSRQRRIHSASSRASAGFDKLITPQRLNTDNLDSQRAYQNDIGSILINYSLSPRWYPYVEHYALNGQKTRVPSGIEFRLDIDELTGQEVITLRITDEVRKADLLAAWPTIIKHQEKLPYRRQAKSVPKRQFERNRKVSLMLADDVPVAEITDYLDEYFPKKNGDPHMHEDVLKMVHAYNSAINAPKS